MWFLGVFLVGLEPMLENVLYLGFAAFFFLAGRGPLSVDRMLFPRLEPNTDLSRYAVPAVRIGVGLSLAFVAFTEKFANIPLGLRFLEEYPLNFTGALGVALSDETFVLCAGAVELLVGLWIALGIFVREVVVVAWVPDKPDPDPFRVGGAHRPPAHLRRDGGAPGMGRGPEEHGVVAPGPEGPAAAPRPAVGDTCAKQVRGAPAVASLKPARLEHYAQLHLAIHPDRCAKRYSRRCPNLRGPT